MSPALGFCGTLTSIFPLTILNMKKIALLSAALFLSACQANTKSVDVVLENNSSTAINNIKVSTTEQLESIELDTLATQGKMEKSLNMENNKIDGSYVIEFQRENGEKETHSEGYYSNGNPLEKKLVFKITDSDVILEPQAK